MYYVYVLLSSKFHIFYIGSAIDLKERIKMHNSGRVQSTKPYLPWTLIWYCAFKTEPEARNFERYLKTGSGRSFAYRHLISVALAKDFQRGRQISHRTKTGIAKPTENYKIIG